MAFLDHQDRLGRRDVLRSKHKRSIQVGHDAAAVTALRHDHLATLPAPGGGRTLRQAERDGQPARAATVVVAWAAVTLWPPTNRRGHERQRPLRVWAVRVWEAQPPPGVAAVPWLLLTKVATATLFAVLGAGPVVRLPLDPGGVP